MPKHRKPLVGIMPLGMARGEAHMSTIDPDIATPEGSCAHALTQEWHYVSGCCHGGHGRHVAEPTIDPAIVAVAEATGLSYEKIDAFIDSAVNVIHQQIMRDENSGENTD